MPFILLYLIKLSISITAVFLFYYLVLRRLTFYNWNRIYLMVCTALSFIIAYVNVEPTLQRSNLANTVWVEWLPPVSINNAVAPIQNTTLQADTSWNMNEWVIFIMLAGMTVMLLRLIIQVLSMRRMLKKAEHFSVRGLHFYQVNEKIIPFSFGNAIFINRTLHTERELQEIIRHEFVHVKQKHSIDILWAEFLCLINWYNPFVWLMRKAIRQNLEFIADDEVLQTGIAKKQYQYSLLKIVSNNQFDIASKFNFTSLKKRIIMMNRNKTTRMHLAKFILILPLVSVLLLAFRKSVYVPLVAHEVEKSLLQEIVDPVNTDTVAVLLPSPLPVRAAVKEIKLPPPEQPVLSTPEGFTGLQGVIFVSGNPEDNVSPKFVNINGKLHYYTEVNNKITYYNLYGQKIDHDGKLLASAQTNASDVLPNQYILKVYKDGELISAFNDNKAGPAK